jgi:general secretion pathway protein J
MLRIPIPERWRQACAPRGFTLVEVLIAIAIFGILAAVSYRALTAVLETRERVEKENRKWRTIAYAITRIEEDIGAVINRQVRDANGNLRPALVGNPVPGPGDGQLVFTRSGELDENGYDTAPQRVGYVLRDGVLMQLTWPVLDQAPGTQPAVTPLLLGVQSIEFAYAGANGQPTPFWPQSGVTGADTSLPIAIAMRITFASGEQMSRLFAIGPALTQ